MPFESAFLLFMHFSQPDTELNCIYNYVVFALEAKLRKRKKAVIVCTVYMKIMEKNRNKSDDCVVWVN